jgi:Zn-dependent alcohol dehydrogenase
VAIFGLGASASRRSSARLAKAGRIIAIDINPASSSWPASWAPPTASTRTTTTSRSRRSSR